jgi:hypothetical protein
MHRPDKRGGGGYWNYRVIAANQMTLSSRFPLWTAHGVVGELLHYVVA